MSSIASLAIAAAILPVALFTMAATPAGWTPRPGKPGPAQAYDSQVSPLTSMLVFPAYPAASFGPAMLRQTLAKMPFCPLAGAFEQPDGDGSLRLVASAADRRCIAQARRLPGGDWRIAFGVATGRTAMPELALRNAVVAFVGVDAPASTPKSAARPTVAEAPAVGTTPRPVGAVMRGENGFTGFPPMVTFTVTPWFLFPGGVATDCARVDPAALQLTLAALRARKDCTGARWRRAGGKIELQIDDDDEWSSDMVSELPPVPAGTRLDFRGQTMSGSGVDNPYGAGSTSSTSYGGFVLTADGRVETSLSTSVNFSSSNAVAYAGGPKRGIRGRYAIDGYILRIALDDGPTIERYVLFDKGGKPTYGHVYFEGRHYWLRGR